MPVTDGAQNPGDIGGPILPEQKKGSVRYVRPAGKRIIDVDDWKKVGVTDQETAVWDENNYWTLPLDKFNEAAIAYLRVDDGFVII